MKIKTHHDPKPVPSRNFDWSAVDDSTYDGSEGSLIGYGATEQEAREDLVRQVLEDEMDRDCKRALSAMRVWDGVLDKLFGHKP